VRRRRFGRRSGTATDQLASEQKIVRPLPLRVAGARQADAAGGQLCSSRWSRAPEVVPPQVCGGESLVGDMGSTRGQVLGLPKKQKIEKTAQCRCAEVIRRRIAKARSSLGLSVKKGPSSVRRNDGETDPKAHLAEQVAGANAHGR
jgi:hypothetical protein